MSRVRLVPIALIAVISLAVFFGAWRLYLQFSLINPLVSRIATVEGVSSAKVESENPPALQVTMKPNYDLQTTYQSILTRISNAGSSNVQVNFTSDNAALWPVFESLEPIIVQGVAHGSFPNMIVSATRQAAKMGAKAVISVDVQHNIYVQISKGHHYFYKIVPPTK